MLKRVWTWLGTPTAARWISSIFAVFYFIVALGSTGSYWLAFKQILVFWAVWVLGRMTVEQDREPPRDAGAQDHGK